LPPLIAKRISKQSERDGRSLSPMESAKVTMRYGQEVELYFFPIFNRQVRKELTFMAIRFSYRGYVAEFAFHDEPFKVSPGVSQQTTYCVELVETTVPTVQQRKIANQALGLLVDVIKSMLLNGDDKVFSYASFAESLHRRLAKKRHVHGVRCMLMVEDSGAKLTDRVTCKQQYQWLQQQQDFIMHVQWTFSFDDMQGLPVNRAFIEEVKRLIYRHNPTDVKAQYMFAGVINRALGLSWYIIEEPEQRRFLFWYYVHLCLLDKLKQRCDAEGLLSSDRGRIRDAALNKDNLTILDLLALNFRFSQKIMFDMPMTTWRAQLQKVVDISGMRSIEHDCLKFTNILAVEVRNTCRGGAKTFGDFARVLSQNYHYANCLADSADWSLANINKLPVVKPSAKSKAVSLFGRAQQPTEDVDYSVPRMVRGLSMVMSGTRH
jgi:hypothetical protein